LAIKTFLVVKAALRGRNARKQAETRLASFPTILTAGRSHRLSIRSGASIMAGKDWVRFEKSSQQVLTFGGFPGALGVCCRKLV
jgi:hypothetical protein